jgi:hypothetical protein
MGGCATKRADHYLPAVPFEGLFIFQIIGIVCQGEEIHFMALGDSPQLVERTDFLPFVRWIRDAMAKEENSHIVL